MIFKLGLLAVLICVFYFVFEGKRYTLFRKFELKWGEGKERRILVVEEKRQKRGKVHKTDTPE